MRRGGKESRPLDHHLPKEYVELFFEKMKDLSIMYGSENVRLFSGSKIRWFFTKIMRESPVLKDDDG